MTNLLPTHEYPITRQMAIGDPPVVSITLDAQGHLRYFQIETQRDPVHVVMYAADESGQISVVDCQGRSGYHREFNVNKSATINSRPSVRPTHTIQWAKTNGCG